MQRVTHATKATDLFGAGKHGYKLAAPYTVLAPDAMNAVQEEIARVIEGFGVTLNGAALDQLFNAITGPGRQNVIQADAATGVFGSTSEPNDHPSSASNKWKLLFYGKTNGGTFIRFLTGDGDADGTWAITWNAAWNPASGAQNWSSDNTGVASTLLLGLPDGMLLQSRNAGAGTWTVWAGTAGALGLSGSLTVGNDLSVADNASVTGNLGVAGDVTVGGVLIVPTISGDVTVSDDLVVGSDIDAGGNVYGAGDVLAGDEFKYTPAQAKTVQVPLSSALVDGDWEFGANFSITFNATFINAIVPLRLPTGAVLTRVRVLFEHAGSAQASVQLLKRSGVNFGGLSAPVQTVITSTLGAASSGIKAADFTGLTTPINNAAEEYFVSMAPGQIGDHLLAVEATFTDPGPRNH